MIFQIILYIKFFFRSIRLHGIHSPFVFDLKRNCLSLKTKYPEYEELKDHRNQLLRDKRSISVQDFGAGSRVFSSNERSICRIAKYAGIQASRQRLLFRLVRHLRPDSILELGTSLGMATVAMALGNKDAVVVTLEGCSNTLDVARQYFPDRLNSRIKAKHTLFEDYLKDNPSKYDLIYVDGNHDKTQTLAYFEWLLDQVHENSCIIFDDINWSKGMNEAWHSISKHPKVTVSIDTFQWGIIFFRKEQEKEHFYIHL